MTLPFVRSMAAVLLAAGVAFATSCASQPEPRPAALDPANPTAPESPTPAMSQVLAPERRVSERGASADAGATGAPAAPTPPPESGGEMKGGEGEHAGHGHQGNESAAPVSAPAPSPSKRAEPARDAAVFTCPMHPEVVSPKPGRCPKCGMKLVPRGASGSGDSK